MFQLARGYRERGMAAYADLQQAEFAAEADGYTASRHQREVGVSYFDAVAMALSGGKSSTIALAGSTETEQFQTATAAPRHDHDEGLVHGHEWATSAPLIG
jgi:isocitrate lyase